MKGKQLAQQVDIKSFKKQFRKVPLVDFSKSVEEVRAAASSQYPELTMSMLQP